jgi:uncharacterized lipoprotein YddW (UPF0748 family)
MEVDVSSLKEGFAKVRPRSNARTTPVLQEREAGEMRGLWVVRDSLTSPESIRRMVANAVKSNFNTLFVQVRGRGDAYYRSPYEPRAEALSDTSPDFDPLQTVIDEARKSGLKVHAWLNTFLAWSGKTESATPRSPYHIWNAHPDWFAADREGRKSFVSSPKSEGAFLQPSNPAVQEHLLKVFSYVAKNYDVDGIHFDYCRYGGAEYDYSPATLNRFKRSGEGMSWEDWRRQQITDLVARISQTVKRDKPWMQVSGAVFADADDAFKARGQDWRRWLQEGYFDSVALMAYSESTAKVLAQTRAALEAANGKHVYVGLGAWRLPVEDLMDKIEKVRAAGAAGVNLFSYNSLMKEANYLPTLARGVFASVANVPRMPWLEEREGGTDVARLEEQPRRKRPTRGEEDDSDLPPPSRR